eukprot:CAMPEP_0194311534 /NCGR_PEP_ID=MMETSP0171-20130528/8460_1 /TAXON_ID=218684 /ORGANISM="Corethron pennatum, Strain L29A3" /LENGTH=357 /DNA_ID=CAMNT_0039065633 /DNA_START=607 /DNA_END=1680 /DNA_ORIENTATION=+
MKPTKTKKSSTGSPTKTKISSNGSPSGNPDAPNSLPFVALDNPLVTELPTELPTEMELPIELPIELLTEQPTELPTEMELPTGRGTEKAPPMGGPNPVPTGVGAPSSPSVTDASSERASADQSTASPTTYPIPVDFDSFTLSVITAPSHHKLLKDDQSFLTSTVAYLEKEYRHYFYKTSIEFRRISLSPDCREQSTQGFTTECILSGEAWFDSVGSLPHGSILNRMNGNAFGGEGALDFISFLHAKENSPVLKAIGSVSFSFDGEVEGLGDVAGVKIEAAVDQLAYMAMSFSFCSIVIFLVFYIFRWVQNNKRRQEGLDGEHEVYIDVVSVMDTVSDLSQSVCTLSDRYTINKRPID